MRQRFLRKPNGHSGLGRWAVQDHTLRVRRQARVAAVSRLLSPHRRPASRHEPAPPPISSTERSPALRSAPTVTRRTETETRGARTAWVSEGLGEAHRIRPGRGGWLSARHKLIRGVRVIMSRLGLARTTTAHQMRRGQVVSTWVESRKWHWMKRMRWTPSVGQESG